MAVKFYDVRADGEWAEFYVNKRDPVMDFSGHSRYSASWCCLSSYGVFGHYWHSMGSPFKQFVAKLEEDYLLCKIGRKIASADVTLDSVRRAIKSIRRNENISKDDAREAWGAVDAIADEYYPAEILISKLSEAEEIEKLELDWTEINTMDWESDAVQFVRKLWPAFVEALNK